MAIIIYLQKSIHIILFGIPESEGASRSDVSHYTLSRLTFGNIIQGGLIMVKLDFGKQNGLIPVIAQDFTSGEVLMFAYMNEESFRLTLETGIVHYFSRSRDRIWKKGETSGNIQRVREIRVDCDSDTLLVKVDQTGAACHEGYRSCFFRVMEGRELRIDAERIADPENLYGEKRSR
jgi:phosphoribosyl-AMP cyclohydrolase